MWGKKENKRMGIALLSLLQSAHTPFLPSPTISKGGKELSSTKKAKISPIPLKVAKTLSNSFSVG